MQDQPAVTITITVPEDRSRRLVVQTEDHTYDPVSDDESTVLLGVSLANQIKAYQVRGNTDSFEYLMLVERFHRIFPHHNPSDLVTCRLAVAAVKRILGGGKDAEYLPTIDTARIVVTGGALTDDQQVDLGLAIGRCKAVGCEVDVRQSVDGAA